MIKKNFEQIRADDKIILIDDYNGTVEIPNLNPDFNLPLRKVKKLKNSYDPNIFITLFYLLKKFFCLN